MGEDGKAVDFKPPGFLGLSQCIIEKALFVFRYQNYAKFKKSAEKACQTGLLSHPFLGTVPF